MNNSISCIIFDFGGVISLQQEKDFFRNLAPQLGIDEIALQKAYRHCREGYDNGSLDGHSYWRHVLEYAGGGVNGVDTDRLVKLDTESWMRIDENVVGVIRKLHSNGVRLALLSNMPWDMVGYIREHFVWIDELLEVVAYSCEIGSAKPNPGIYIHTIGQLAVEAKDCLFIDDNETNIAAAQKLGMSTILFKSAADISGLSSPKSDRGEQEAR